MQSFKKSLIVEQFQWNYLKGLMTYSGTVFPICKVSVPPDRHQGASKQPRRRRQHKPQNFAYLTIKTVFLHALHLHFSSLDILKTISFFLRREMISICFAVVWTTRAYHDKLMLIFVFWCPKRWFQFNSSVVGTHFSSVMTLNIWKMIT